jgi:hypothetical protein
VAFSFSRVPAVEAESPKNSARMSLSIPMTSNPSACSRLLVSDPIRPADPVIIAMLILFVTVTLK